jgi:hypothetical protein
MSGLVYMLSRSVATREDMRRVKSLELGVWKTSIACAFVIWGGLSLFVCCMQEKMWFGAHIQVNIITRLCSQVARIHH